MPPVHVGTCLMSQAFMKNKSIFNQTSVKFHILRQQQKIFSWETYLFFSVDYLQLYARGNAKVMCSTDLVVSLLDKMVVGEMRQQHFIGFADA